MMGKYLNGYMPADPIPPGWDEWDVTGQRLPGVQLHPERKRHPAALRRRPGRLPHRRALVEGGLVYCSSASSGQAVHARGGHVRAARAVMPAPRYAHAEPGLPTRRPRPTTGCRQSAVLAGAGPPLAPAEQRRITSFYRKRVEDDLSVDDMIGHLEASCGPRAWPRTPISSSAPTTATTWASTGYPRQADRLRHRHPRPLIVTGPGVPAGPRPQLASNIDLCPRSRPWPACPCRPRRRPQPGGSVARAASRGLAAGHPHRAPRPGRQAGDPDRQSRRGDPPSYEAVRTATALYVGTATASQEYYDTATIRSNWTTSPRGASRRAPEDALRPGELP